MHGPVNSRLSSIKINIFAMQTKGEEDEEVEGEVEKGNY